MKKNKKEFIISITALVLIIVLVLGATYAYFAAQTGDPASTDIKITTATVDSLTFSTGNAISLSATQSNFGTGKSSLSDSTTATATLVPNNSTNSAEATYYLYVKISSNDFSYTTDDYTAELILGITDPDGNAVTSLSGLTYTTVTDNTGVSYSGFDVTTKTGLIAIAELYSIVADGATQVDDWTITLTFVNLSTDQSANAGASFTASVIIQAEELTVLAGAISTFTTDGTAGLYYFDGEGNYTNADLEAVDYSYRYVGGTYVLSTTATDAGYTTIDDTSSSTDTGVISFYCSRGTSYSYIGASCSSSYTGYFYLNYDTEVTQYSTYREAAEQAVSDGYLEYGVKNYICFGSDAETCSDDNLYRIIGFFLNDAGEYEMKIIKADGATSTQLGTDGDYYNTYYSSWSSSRSHYKGNTSLSSVGSYYWNYTNYDASYTNSGYYNDWSYSQLNTVNLNTNYYNSLDSTWQNMISEHTWNIGGGSSSDLYSGTASSAYNAEMISPSDQLGYTTYTSNVGLMYVNDYAYSALPSYWTTDLSSYSGTALRETNWMYSRVYEWAISRSSSYAIYAFLVYDTGYVGDDVVSSDSAVRPVLYLVSSVSIVNGEGTIDSPYIIG